jgi:eukaryotic translation initiation factor 2C
MKYKLFVKLFQVSCSKIDSIRINFLLEIYGNESKHPLLTFIVVKKRHNTRFFTYNPNSTQPRFSKSKKPPKETDNMSIGAVIDTRIVHPYENDFYLNSHNAYQGVNHPSLYHVLLDEIGFTANQLQLLTYHLCFTDARSSASEAIPSVVHQADIAALKARDLFYNDDEFLFKSTGMDMNERRKSSSLNEINYEILHVHEKLRNLPVLG